MIAHDNQNVKSPQLATKKMFNWKAICVYPDRILDPLTPEKHHTDAGIELNTLVKHHQLEKCLHSQAISLRS